MELIDFGEEDRVESRTERNDAGVTDGMFMMSHLPRNVVLCGLRHHGFEEFEALHSSTSSSEMAPNWRPKQKMSTIVLWDLDREQRVSTIPSSEASISTLSASQVHNAQVAAGFKDGSVRLYDIRTPEMIVCRAQLHDQGEGRVVGLGFQPGWDPLKIVSASPARDIQFLDIRKGNDPYLSRHPCKGSLTSFVVHRHAPAIASGYANRCVKVLDLNGDQLGSIDGKIGSISCLDFHPYEALLAAGATDASLSIYDD